MKIVSQSYFSYFSVPTFVLIILKRQLNKMPPFLRLHAECSTIDIAALYQRSELEEPCEAEH